jgi:branched-chain amino acid transport system substrate-binding protein
MAMRGFPRNSDTRRAIFGAALLIACLLLPQGVLAAEAEPIKVGILSPMTGSVAAYGQMVYKGIELAHQMKPKVLGRPVKLILVDTKSDAVEAANGASRLVKKDGVVAILGPVTSTRALAAAPIAESAGIPLISPAATSPILTQGKKYTFRVCFIDPFQGQVAARYAYQNLAKRRAALLIDVSQDYSVGLAAFFMREFKRLGGKIVARVKCNTGDQDFSAQLGAIKASKADVLYLPNYYTEDALVARQARELGLGIPLLSGDGAQAPELINIGGPAVEGFSFTSHFHPEGAQSALGKAFIGNYQQRKKTGHIQEDLASFHVLGADAYFLLLDAIKRAGSIEGAELRQALAGTRGFRGASGSFSIGPNGNAIKSAVILKVQDGKFSYVTTMDP